jgi:fused signal recognition particle receptor
MKNWFSKLRSGLSKTSANLSTNIKKAFALNRPNKEILDDIEEILISSDLGVQFSGEVIEKISKRSFNTNITKQMVIDCVVEDIESILKPYTKELTIPNSDLPYTIVFSGINGSGKTTSLGKIAHKLQMDGYRVLIAACDSFRASATEQLEIWAKRSNCEIITGEYKSDPASIAYKALIKARNENFDVLLIDTAGRMHNKIDLMNELQKINKVLKKNDQVFPQLNLLVIDATIGQIAIKQVENFKDIVDINGIILTKLDGTSKAGVIVPITQKFKLPIYLVGVGEGVEDLNTFSAKDFAEALLSG